MEKYDNYVDISLARQSERIRNDDLAFYFDKSRWLTQDNCGKYYYCAPTNRTIQEIAAVHHMSLDELCDEVEGKTVLDIGGGKSSLQSWLGAYSVAANVVNLDMKSAFEPVDENNGVHMQANGEEIPVIAHAHSMPLRDESVDVVLATYSTPTYAMTADSFENDLNEILRVLKVGGFASLAPYGGFFFGDNAIVAKIRLLGMVRSMSNMPELDIELEYGGAPLRIHKHAMLREV